MVSFYVAEFEVYLKSKLAELEIVRRKNQDNKIKNLQSYNSGCSESKASVYYTPTDRTLSPHLLQLSPLHINYVNEDRSGEGGSIKEFRNFSMLCSTSKGTSKRVILSYEKERKSSSNGHHKNNKITKLEHILEANSNSKSKNKRKKNNYLGTIENRDRNLNECYFSVESILELSVTNYSKPNGQQGTHEHIHKPCRLRPSLSLPELSTFNSV